MSVIDAQNSTEAVNISLFSNQFDFLNQDPAGINGPDNYSWLTSGGDDVEARGLVMDFTDPTPDFGDVDEIDFDLGNSGPQDPPDVTIRNITGATGVGGITPANLGVIVDSVTDFFDEIMSFDDDFTGSDFNDTLKGGGGEDNIVAGDGNDSCSGGDDNDSILGEDGNDTLVGDAGDDTLEGGDDNDTLTGGTGADSMIGGLGNDVYNVDNVGDFAGEVAGGVDLVNASVDHDLTTNMENLTMTGTGDVDGTGNSKANIITGNSGDNRLRGLSSNDTITGGSGGNDTLDGGTGADSMTGNIGNTVYIVDNVGDSASEVAGGTDRVESSVTWSLVPSPNIENLTLTGAGNIDGEGNSTRANVIIGNSGANEIDGLGLNDTLTGGGGNDTMDGGDNNDTVDGQGGADELYGGANNDSILGGGAGDFLGGDAGNDTLDGGTGADVLVGGAGTDFLTGGVGADLFDFNATSESGPAAATRDVIQGFDNPGAAGTERIDLSTIDADTTSANATFSFLGHIQNPNPPATGAGSIWLRNEGGNTIVYANVDNDNAAEMAIQINDGATLANAYTDDDFFL